VTCVISSHAFSSLSKYESRHRHLIITLPSRAFTIIDIDEILRLVIRGTRRRRGRRRAEKEITVVIGSRERASERGHEIGTAAIREHDTTTTCASGDPGLDSGAPYTVGFSIRVAWPRVITLIRLATRGERRLFRVFRDPLSCSKYETFISTFELSIRYSTIYFVSCSDIRSRDRKFCE